MNDRELLELAAKGAGVKVRSWSGHYATLEDGSEWIPLYDDGDALRLAVIINKVRVFIYEDEVSMGALGIVEPHDGSKEGKQGAARRAIVRAAAEIGKSL